MTPLMKKLLTIGVAMATLSAAPTSSHAGGFGIGAGIAAGIIGGIIASQVARPRVVYITPRVRVVRVRGTGAKGDRARADGHARTDGPADCWPAEDGVT